MGKEITKVFVLDKGWKDKRDIFFGEEMKQYTSEEMRMTRMFEDWIENAYLELSVEDQEAAVSFSMDSLSEDTGALFSSAYGLHMVGVEHPYLTSIFKIYPEHLEKHNINIKELDNKCT